MILREVDHPVTGTAAEVGDLLDWLCRNRLIEQALHLLLAHQARRDRHGTHVTLAEVSRPVALLGEIRCGPQYPSRPAHQPVKETACLIGIVEVGARDDGAAVLDRDYLCPAEGIEYVLENTGVQPLVPAVSVRHGTS